MTQLLGSGLRDSFRKTPYVDLHPDHANNVQYHQGVNNRCDVRLSNFGIYIQNDLATIRRNQLRTNHFLEKKMLCQVQLSDAINDALTTF